MHSQVLRRFIFLDTNVLLHHDSFVRKDVYRERGQKDSKALFLVTETVAQECNKISGYPVQKNPIEVLEITTKISKARSAMMWQQFYDMALTGQASRKLGGLYPPYSEFFSQHNQICLNEWADFSIVLQANFVASVLDRKFAPNTDVEVYFVTGDQGLLERYISDDVKYVFESVKITQMITMVPVDTLI